VRRQVPLCAAVQLKNKIDFGERARGCIFTFSDRERM